MASNFNISRLSGTGTATITVKPKAVNDTEDIKEQILKISVQDVEREVTLIQKERQILESWKKSFRVDNKPSSTFKFPGNTTGSTLKLEVFSYEQKYINDTPQEEYRVVPWEASIIPGQGSSNWLELSKEESTSVDVPGILTLKCISKNNEYGGPENDPIARTLDILVTQTDSSESDTFSVSQGIGNVTYSLEFNENGLVVSEYIEMEGSKTLYLNPVINKEINLKTVKVYDKLRFKIPTAFTDRQTPSYKGTVPQGNLSVDYAAECWITSPDGSTNWDYWSTGREVTCHFKLTRNRIDRLTQQYTGAYPKWGIEWNFDLLPSDITRDEVRNMNDEFYFFT